MTKPTPKHSRVPARRLRRAEPRHVRQAAVSFSAIGTLAVTVAGVAVVATSTYGFVPGPAAASDSSTPSMVAAAEAPPALADATVQGRRGGITGSGTKAVNVVGSVDTHAAQLAGEPAFVSIPSTGITSGLIELGLTAEHTLQVPDDFLVAGWYKRGPRPGDPGPAIIAGHLDSYTGPAVFSRLDRVKPGDQIFVTRKDGTTLEFAVTRIDQYPKRAFPTRQVYGKTDAPELRLITCGGSFDRSAGSYRSNTVVYAKLVPGVNVGAQTSAE